MKPLPFLLCDLVRETGLAIHCFLGPGHLEKVYENALAHRLRKRGVEVESQVALAVRDEDGTCLGEFRADLMVEGALLIETKAARAVATEHLAQLLGYLRSGRIEHGALLNFGAPVFYIKMYAMSESLRQTRSQPTRSMSGQPGTER